MTRIALPALFINDSGAIQNLNVPADRCNFVSIIESLPGSRRSSHLHRTDSHYLYVISGKMLYADRMPGHPASDWQTVEPGQCVYTPPKVEHWTKFPERTVLVSVSAKARDTQSHESDVVRVPWLEE